VTLNVGLFNGFQRSIARQNAALSIKNARLQLEQSQLQTQNALASAWDAYQNALLQTQVLNRNVQTSTLNYERSMELFQQGQLNAVQIRDAQLALQQAEISLLRQQLQAFLAKVELQRLSGRLVAR
jgi:outer membrane protein TolC